MSFCKDFYGDREFLVKVYLDANNFDFESICILTEKEIDILYYLKETKTEFITIREMPPSDGDLVSFKVDDFFLVWLEEGDSHYLANQDKIKAWLEYFDNDKFEEFLTDYGGSYITKYLFEKGELEREENDGLYISLDYNGRYKEICIVKDVSEEDYKILEILKRKDVKFNKQKFTIEYYKSISGVEIDPDWEEHFHELIKNYKGLSNPETLKDSLEYFNIELLDMI